MPQAGSCSRARLANFRTHAATTVDFEKEDRAPLLFIAGGQDHNMPAKLNRWNFEHYKSGIVAFPRVCGDATLHVRRPGLAGRRRLRARVGARASRDGR